MNPAVADLEASLQAMLSLKPPGVSGSRITGITNLCVDNVKSESVLIQKIFTHFKKAPGTHKLGMLYVVDCVTRKWLERAKIAGQAVNSSALDGTFAAGVHRVTELMPVLMNDIITSAPPDQKDKLKKLVDIWDKGLTFPLEMVQAFKTKLAAHQPPPIQSTTPTNSPPRAAIATAIANTNAAAAAAAAPKPASSSTAPDSAAVMQALANIARQNTAAASSNPHPIFQEEFNQMAKYGIGLPKPSIPVAPSAGQHGLSGLIGVPSGGAATLPFAYSPQLPVPTQTGVVPNAAIGAANAFPAALAALSAGPVVGLDPSTQQQLMIIQALHAQGVPFDKIPVIIQTMAAAGANAAIQPSAFSTGSAPAWLAQRPDKSRDRQHEAAQSPRFGNRTRSQSRSRARSRSRSKSPRRWGSPRAGGGRDRADYNRRSPARDRELDRGRRAEYRERSPHSRRAQSSTPPVVAKPETRWIEFDQSLPAGCIKVFSRTLFVGGVTVSESELQRVFDTFGRVQTCIVNKDKRHAFVKMVTRQDAEKAMKDKRTADFQLRTRWGVGFGPRDCSDYSTGISIIPIHKLTEADRKWLLTADFGGTGGKSIEPGMCCEEPDIEIGKGVSSKAISRRMQTDKGGSNGPKSTRFVGPE